MCLPVSWLNYLADLVWHVVTTKLIFFLIGAFALIKLMIYERLFLTLIDVFARVYGGIDWFLQLVASPVVSD